jgi:hypothetical protein
MSWESSLSPVSPFRFRGCGQRNHLGPCDACNRYSFVATFLAAHDSNSRYRDVQTGGEQTSKRIIRTIFYRRSGEANLKCALIIAFVASRLARGVTRTAKTTDPSRSEISITLSCCARRKGLCRREFRLRLPRSQFQNHGSYPSTEHSRAFLSAR